MYKAILSMKNNVLFESMRTLIRNVSNNHIIYPVYDIFHFHLRIVTNNVVWQFSGVLVSLVIPQIPL